MILEPPVSVQKLQVALQAKAKEAPDYRFYLLYDELYRKARTSRWRSLFFARLLVDHCGFTLACCVISHGGDRIRVSCYASGNDHSCSCCFGIFAQWCPVF